VQQAIDDNLAGLDKKTEKKMDRYLAKMNALMCKLEDLEQEMEDYFDDMDK
jgi:hypothetical protein